MRRSAYLILTFAALALLAACQAVPKPDGGMPQSALIGGGWLLTEIAGQTVAANEQRPPFLVFGADNHVSGSGGCNRLSGEYHLASGQLHFSRLISTRMACLDMRTETALLAVLPTVSSCALSEGGNILIFYNSENVPVATFSRDQGGLGR